MKVPHAHQEVMLQVAGLDLELEALSSRLAEFQTGAHLDALRTNLFAASSRMLEQQTQLENLQQELRKLEADIELVDKRINLDKQRLSSTSSSKDAEGITSELRSLATRKSNLEDQELEIMEQVEQVSALVATESASRTSLSVELAEADAPIPGTAPQHARHHRIRCRHGRAGRQNSTAHRVRAVQGQQRGRARRQNT